MCVGSSGVGGGGTGVPSTTFSAESKAAIGGDGTASTGLGGFANASAAGFGEGGPGPNIPASKSTVAPAAEKESPPSTVSTANQRAAAKVSGSRRASALVASSKPSASTTKTSGQGLLSKAPTAKKSLLGG